MQEAVQSPFKSAADRQHRTEVAAATVGQLTEAELTVVLLEAGWPESLVPEALRVAWCESRWRPDAVSGGGHLGLFQLSSLWFSYSGIDIAGWAIPVVNARVAWITYQYDLERGQTPWNQWACQP